MRKHLLRLRADRSGVALIEFAFALPLLLTVGLGGTEVANLAVTVLRINQLAMLAADNAARVRGSMDEQDVEEVMIGIRFAGEGIDFGQNGRIIISDLEANGQSGQKKGYQITWQRCFGAKNALSSFGNQDDGVSDATLAKGMGGGGQKITPVANSAVIFAELRYTYRPLVGSMFMPDQELTAIQAFPVRERATQALTNTKNIPDSAKRLCDTGHLSAD